MFLKKGVFTENTLSKMLAVNAVSDKRRGSTQVFEKLSARHFGVLLLCQRQRVVLCVVSNTVSFCH